MFFDWFFNALRKEDELKKLRLECFCHKARADALIEENRLLAAENVVAEAEAAKWRRKSGILEQDLNRTAEEASRLRAALARCEKKLAAGRRSRVWGFARRGE